MPAPKKKKQAAAVVQEEGPSATLKGAAAYVHQALLFKRKLVAERFMAIFTDMAATYRNDVAFCKTSLDSLGGWLRKYPEVVAAQGAASQVAMIVGLCTVRDTLGEELAIFGESPVYESTGVATKIRAQMEREGEAALPAGVEPANLIAELYTGAKKMLRRLMDLIPDPAAFQEAYRASIVDSMPPPDPHEEEELPPLDLAAVRWREEVPRWAREVEACVRRLELAAAASKKLAVAFVLSRQLVPVEALRLMKEQRVKEAERRRRVAEARAVVEGRRASDPVGVSAPPLVELDSPAASSAPSEDEEAPPGQAVGPRTPSPQRGDGQWEEEGAAGAGEGEPVEDEAAAEERRAMAAAMAGELEALLQASGKRAPQASRRRAAGRQLGAGPAREARRLAPAHVPRVARVQAAHSPPQLSRLTMKLGDVSPPRPSGGFGFGTASRFGDPVPFRPAPAPAPGQGPRPARSPPRPRPLAAARSAPALPPGVAVTAPAEEGERAALSDGDAPPPASLAPPPAAPRRLSLIERQAAAALAAAQARFAHWMQPPEQAAPFGEMPRWGVEGTPAPAPYGPAPRRSVERRTLQLKRADVAALGVDGPDEVAAWPVLESARRPRTAGSGSESGSEGEPYAGPVLPVRRSPPEAPPTVWHSYEAERPVHPRRAARAGSLSLIDTPEPPPAAAKAPSPAPLSPAPARPGPLRIDPHFTGALRAARQREAAEAPHHRPPRHMNFLVALSAAGPPPLPPPAAPPDEPEKGRRRRRSEEGGGAAAGVDAERAEVAALLALLWNRQAGGAPAAAPPRSFWG